MIRIFFNAYFIKKAIEHFSGPIVLCNSNREE